MTDIQSILLTLKEQAIFWMIKKVWGKLHKSHPLPG